MRNIPTELLRALVTVVDLRSFTRAAQALGVTQPAVSAQIKRLQMLLGSDLLDKSAPGVSLTQVGELVANEARQLLAINDRIMQSAAAHGSSPTLRVGLPGDFAGHLLMRPLALFRKRWPNVHLHVRAGPSIPLVQDLRQGELDLVVAMSGTKPMEDARFHWLEEMAWVRSPFTRVNLAEPIPLVSHGPYAISHQHVVAVLEKAGLSHDLVFVGTGLASLTSAVAVGFGVLGLPRSLFVHGDLEIWDDGPLPRIPPIVCSICMRDHADRFLRELAEAFAGAVPPTQEEFLPEIEELGLVESE